MTNAKSNPHRWIILLTVAAGLLLVTLDNSILYTALPKLTLDLGASVSQGLWIINAYPLVMAGLLLGAGTLGDRIGHRTMFLSGLIIFSVASLIAAFSPSPGILIGARALLAVGASSMMPATLSLIRVTFIDDRERNLAIAIWGCIAIVGAALGPIIGGFLLQHFWWGAVFLINIPVATAALITGIAIVPSTKVDHSKPWDYVSSIQALIALCGLVIAIKYSAKITPSWEIVVPALLIAVVGSWMFTRRQYRLPYPLLDFSIFRNAAFLSGVIAAAVSLFAIGGIQLVTTQRFQLIVGFSPLQSGMVVSTIALGCLPTTIFGGAFLHKIGLRFLIAGGLFVASIGVIVTILGIGDELMWFIAGLLLTGAGLGAAISVASTAIVGNVPAQRAGMASSVEEVAYEFGSLFAVAILGSALTAVYSATVNLPTGVPESARDNITSAMAYARGEGSLDLIQAASSAFDHSYTIMMFVVAAVLFLGSIVTFSVLKKYGPGSQASAHGSH